MTKIITTILFLVVFVNTSFAQTNIENVLMDSIETVQIREESILSHLQQIQKQSSVPIPIDKEQYQSIPVLFSFPNGTISDNSPVRVITESDFYFYDTFIHRNSTLWGRGHFTNGRYMIKITYYNGTQIDCDIFDMIDWKLGVYIDINSKQSIKSRSTFKAEVNIGTIAKFSAEVEQTKEGATCISVKNNISFSGHMLPNYETYSSQHVSSIPL